jgi:hypothetical protein
LRLTSLTLAVTVLAALLLSSPSLAMRRFGLEGGYVTTSRAKYGSGFVYGATIMEGVGRFGFGLSMQRFANSFTSQRMVLDTRTGKMVTYRYADHISDFFLTILATYMRDNPRRATLLIAGLGPQIHFLAAEGDYYIKGSPVSARDSRLGVGAILRYERVIGMFGGTTLVAAASVSWMESGLELADEYTPPPDGLTSASITVGLAFPF